MSRMRFRNGYTLIEMLIASVLVTALMSAVWSMLSMYSSYLTAGQSQAVEQQLIRSLFQWIETDLQSVAITDTNPKIVPSFNLNDALLTQMQSPTSSSPAVQPNDAALGTEERPILEGLEADNSPPTPSRVSLVGSNSSFQLTFEERPSSSRDVLASGPQPTQDAVPSMATAGATTADDFVTEPSFDESIGVDGVAPSVVEHQTVVWQFESPGMTTGTPSLKSGLYRIQTESFSLQTLLNQQKSLLEYDSSSRKLSVDRTTLESLVSPSIDGSPEPADGNEDSETTHQPAPRFDLVQEIVSCQFAYFNGSAWSATWNSDQMQGLPLAIRVRLQLVGSQDIEKLETNFGAAVSHGSSGEDSVESRVESPTASDTLRSSSTNDSTADPLSLIRTRLVERVILLQPINGPMPDPTTNGEASLQEAAQ